MVAPACGYCFVQKLKLLLRRMLTGGCDRAVLCCAVLWCDVMLLTCIEWHCVGPKAAALCYLRLLEASSAEDDCV